MTVALEDRARALQLALAQGSWDDGVVPISGWRIRAMHDDAQSKRDLDTIDRFLDGQK